MASQRVEFRKKRLAAAVDKAGGQAALGRKLGLRDGSYVGQMLRQERPIGEDTIEKIEALPGFSGWFSDTTAWPFSQELYAAVRDLGESDLRHAENALRAHLKMDPLARPSGESHGSAERVDARKAA